MFQWIFDRALSRNNLLAGLFYRLRVAVAAFYDPVVTYRLHNQRLRLRLSHELPTYRRNFPTYSENLSRLAAFVRERAGKLCMIDVGANIGDSYALAGSCEGDSFLLIEGAPEYAALLEANTRHDPRVTRVQALLADHDGEQAVRIATNQGTGSVVTGGQPQRMYTLDRLLEAYPHFRACNLLKVDVDGHDAQVLAGARTTLAERRPVLFFEHSPRELMARGQAPETVRQLLRELGYTHCHYYDNFGVLIGEFHLDDEPTLAKLDAYASRRAGYYYDLCCFHASQEALARDFLAQEVSHDGG